MTTYVVDRSNNNPPSDAELDEMRSAGIAGLILKATEGAGFVDPTFVGRAQAAHARGLVVGAYAFIHANVGAQAQSDLFNRVVDSAGIPVPVRCSDSETADGDVWSVTAQFCAEASINLLYSGAYFLSANLNRPIPGVELWIAAYGSQRPAAPWGTEAGWQFSESSRWGDCSIFDDNVWAQLTGQSHEEDDMARAITCTDPVTGGTWEAICDDGEVDTDDGAPYLGGLNNHPDWHSMDAAHPVVAIEPWKDPNGLIGYKIGEYDPNPPAGHGRIRWYRFPRDGRYR